MDIKIIKDDITKLDNSVDCIVNAANESLLGGGGVDGEIHRAAGPQLREECATLGGCKPGEAKATKAYRLPQKYIIHTVGPRYRTNKNPAETLRRCYINSLALADSLGCKSIAFPSIATGIYGYPVEEASKIVANVLLNFEGKNIQKIYMVIFPKNEDDYKTYVEAFKEEANK